MATLRRIAPYLVVLFAFAMRMHAIDTTLIDGDQANPHGIGLIIFDSLSRGEFTEFLLFNDNASTGWPNPPLAGYVWAAVALFERGMFSATAFGLIVNTLVVPITFVTGRHCFGWQAGMLAATLMAASNWGVYLARGMWHPGQLEIGVVTSACLLATGINDSNPRRLFAGFVAVVLTAGMYFTALFMPVQAAIATLAANAWQPKLRRAWLAGVGVCVVGLGAFALSMLLMGRLNPASIAKFSLFNKDPALVTEADLVARDITPMNRDPSGHFFRLANNADYALVWTNPHYQGYQVRQPLTQVLAALICVFIVIGLARMALNIRRPTHRFLLLWAALPILALLIIALFKHDFRISIYYLLMTTPVAHLAGGYGMVTAVGLLKRVRRVSAGGAVSAPLQIGERSWGDLATVAVCAGLAVIPAWNFGAAAESIYKQPFTGLPDFMPLRWSQNLGRLWQRECKVINGSNFWWDLSLVQDPARWRRGGTRYNDFSSMWTFNPEGGACAVKQKGAPLPNAELLPLQLDDGDGSIVRTYRALPYEIGRNLSTTVNLGWTLLDFTAPQRAAAGSTIDVQHAWRVDTLPDEPYAHWHFAPFVKLIAPDGELVVDIDRAAALEGWEWRPGEVLLSDVQIQLPGDLPPGTYKLQTSLFDPNQKKNAVYFNVNEPDKPILTLERDIRIERS